MTAEGGSPPHSEAATQDARARAACVALVYALTPRSLLASLAVSTLCAVFFYDETTAHATPFWWTALTAVTAWRYGLTRRFRAARPAAPEAAAWARSAAASAGLAGALWGVWITLLGPAWGSPGYPVAVFMAAGIPAVALNSNSPVFGVHAAFMLPILLPFAAKLLLGGGERFQVLGGVAALIYAAALASLGRLASRNAAESFALRFRNLDLVEGTTRANEVLRAEIGRRQQAEQVLVDAKEAAEAASRAKSRFLAMMSHEIRTPINGVLGMTELLKASGLSAEQARYAGHVDTSARSLLHVIDDILDFSQVEAGRLTLDRTDFDVRATLAGAVGLLAPEARDRGLSLEWTAEEAVPALVRGDSRRLRQILVNLVGNAVKFTRAGSVAVRVALMEAPGIGGRLLRFEVRDTGPGIPEEEQAALFQPFTQVDASAARRFEGTGLGLAICRQLAELMGGAIGVESRPGAGSCFWFTIRCEVPLRADLDRVEPVAPAALVQLRGTVLLVEDNPVNREVALAALEGHGCGVEVAEDGAAAVARAARRRYDAILMDCEMPGLDGYEATRAIRAHEARAAASPEACRVPVIALTASALPADRARALEAGMDEHLPKPFTRAQLGLALSRFLAAASEKGAAALG